MLLYLVVMLEAVSTARIREEGGVQKLVYYVTRALNRVEIWYLKIKIITFVVVMATRSATCTLRDGLAPSPPHATTWAGGSGFPPEPAPVNGG